MTGKIIYRPHDCADDRVSQREHPVGTIWECECGKKFEIERFEGRSYWVWSNAPEKPKKKRWWKS